jgi:hypothetical protein
MDFKSEKINARQFLACPKNPLAGQHQFFLCPQLFRLLVSRMW